MKFLAATLLALCVVARAADEAPAPAITFEELALPSAPGALGASLAMAPDGIVWLSWVEPGADDTNTLRYSTFNTSVKRWRGVSKIIAGHGLTTNTVDFPQVVARHTSALVFWTDGHGSAFHTEFGLNGAITIPKPFILESNEVEKFSFAVLADGRILTAWLDGRGKKDGSKRQQLFARVLDTPGPDTLVDPSVCDCCPTALTAFPDGGALLAYRGRTDEEARDIRTARFDGRAWAESRPLNQDDWRLRACPVNGPRLASDGGRVAAAWFTAADNDPRVLASFSPDAGTRFLMPLRIDHGKPAGHVDVVILHDGALLVTWLESDGSVWLRRVTPEFTADAPVCLAPAGATSVKTIPRAALLRDYAGGKTAAQLIVAFATGDAAPLRTLLVTVPEGALLDAAKNCDCAPTAEQLRGYPLRGTIAAVDADRGRLRVTHEESPGVLAAGSHEFTATPDVIAAVQAGRQFLGRIERRSGAWQLFDVRLFAAPASAPK